MAQPAVRSAQQHRSDSDVDQTNPARHVQSAILMRRWYQVSFSSTLTRRWWQLPFSQDDTNCHSAYLPVSQVRVNEATSGLVLTWQNHYPAPRPSFLNLQVSQVPILNEKQDENYAQFLKNTKSKETNLKIKEKWNSNPWKWWKLYTIFRKSQVQRYQLEKKRWNSNPWKWWKYTQFLKNPKSKETNLKKKERWNSNPCKWWKYTQFF